MHRAREGIWGTGNIIMSPQQGRYIAGILCLLSAVFLSSSAIAAGFTTNFQPTSSTVWIDQQGYCPFGSQCIPNQFGNGDPTPFELNLVTVGGVQYFHTLVGDPATGFAIESYTRYRAGPNAVAGEIRVGDFSPDSGGNEQSVIGGFSDPITAAYLENNANSANPFVNVHASGSGSQDPTKVVVRMVLTSADGTMSQEFYKPFLDKKPRITETIADGAMAATFVADMTALGYNDMNSPIKLVNNLYMYDPGLDNVSRNFEMALAQDPYVTAGRYTYVPGTKWDTIYGWDSPNSTFGLGTYTYLNAETGFNPYTFAWKDIFDYYQNALSCVRPSINGNYRNLNTTAAHGGGASCPGHP